MSKSRRSRGRGTERARSRKSNKVSGAGRGLILYIALSVTVVVGLQRLSSSRGNRPAAFPLNALGLRVSGAGRGDASRVLPAALFSDPRVQNAYRVAAAIPEMLNKLYCWCGCIARGMRSNLQCFESEHAAQCDVCLAGAEVAWELHAKGITDPAKVQQVLDARFAPPSS